MSGFVLFPDGTLVAWDDPAKPRVRVDQPESAAFQAFWAAYPTTTRKVNRRGAWIVWQRAGLDDEGQNILGGLEWFKRSSDWHREGGAYVPLPTTFLRQRRWESAGAWIDPNEEV